MKDLFLWDYWVLKVHASGYLDVSQFLPFIGSNVVRWRPPVYNPSLGTVDSVFFLGALATKCIQYGAL